MAKPSTRTSQVVFLILGGLITQGGSVLSAALIARHLSVADYGTIRQALFVYALLVPVVSGALPMTILFYLPRLGHGAVRKKFVFQTALLLAAAGIIIGLGVQVFAGLISRRLGNPSLVTALRLTAAYPLVMLAGAWYSPYLVASGRAADSTRYSLLTSVLLLIAAGCTLIGGATPEKYLLYYVVAQALASAYAFLGVRSLDSEISDGLSISLGDQLRYAAPLGLAALVSVWGLRIDQAVIASRFSVSAYAIYSAGAMELPLVSLVSSSIFAVLLPDISRHVANGDLPGALLLWRSAVRKSMTVLLPLFGASFILAIPLTIGLYGMRYALSGAVFAIYLFYIPVRTISFGLFLRAAGKTGYDLAGSIGFLALNTMLSLAGVRAFGLFGPAIGAVLSTYCLAAFFVFATQREMGVSPSELLIPKELGSIALLTVVPAALIWVLFRLSLTSPKPMWIYIIAAVTYGASISVSYGATGRWRLLR